MKPLCGQFPIYFFIIFLQLTITLLKEDVDVEKNQHHTYCYAGGLVEYVRWLNTDKVCLNLSLSLRDVFIFLCSDFFFNHGRLWRLLG